MQNIANRPETMTTNSTPEQKCTVAPHIEALEPYKPGKPPAQLQKELNIESFINLASNENSLGTPASVLEAVKEGMSELNRYPEAGGLTLRAALAERYRIKMENVAIGAGSESILSNAIRAFLHGSDEVITSEGTFIGLYVMVNAKGVKLTKIPLKNYNFDLDGIADAVSERTKVIYLCNPNNPTGTIFERAAFEKFISRVPEHVLVILDEAYYEFACKNPEYPDSMTYRLDNVLTLRTFSKAFGMAGLRLGFGMGHERIIDYINRIKLPFEPTVLAQKGGLAALKEKDFLIATIDNNESGKSFIKEALDRYEIPNIESQANFILIEMKTEERAKALNEGLLRQGIAIRPLGAFGLPTCLRITIGKEEENALLVESIGRLVQKGAI